MPRNRFVGFAFVLLVLIGASQAAAILECSNCGCNHSCSTTCVTNTGWSTCQSTGVCSGSSACGGGGCLMVADPDLVKALQEGPQRLPGFEQGRLAARLTWRLAQFAEESGLGEVYTAETGFLLAPDRGGVHIPVLSFIRRERLDGEMVKGFRIGAPDLVAEIRTASASPVEKARAWLAAGTRAVLVLDPAARTVTLYQGRAARKVFGADEVLTIPDVVPGWELPVRNLFD